MLWLKGCLSTNLVDIHDPCTNVLLKSCSMFRFHFPRYIRLVINPNSRDLAYIAKLSVGSSYFLCSWILCSVSSSFFSMSLMIDLTFLTSSSLKLDVIDFDPCIMCSRFSFHLFRESSSWLRVFRRADSLSSWSSSRNLSRYSASPSLSSIATLLSRVTSLLISLSH